MRCGRGTLYISEKHCYTDLTASMRNPTKGETWQRQSAHTASRRASALHVKTIHSYPPPHSQLAQFSYTKTVSSTSRQDAPRDADFSAHIRRTETASDGIPIPRNITYPRQSAVIIRGTAISSLYSADSLTSPQYAPDTSRQAPASPKHFPDTPRQDPSMPHFQTICGRTLRSCKMFRAEGGLPPWQTAEKRCRTVDFPRGKIGRRT